MTIGWNETIAAYNRRNNTRFIKVADVLRHCYKKHGRSVHRVGEELSVSGFTINKKMKEFGIKRQRRFGNPKNTIYMDIVKNGLDREKISTMSLREIAAITGRQGSSIANFLATKGWDWKKTR